MDAFGFASECNNNNGYESGWTHYLDHSFIASNPTREEYRGDKEDNVVVVGEEDGLSMVSDASSGPPHDDNGNGCCFNDGIDDDQNRNSVPKLAALDKNCADEHGEQGSLLDDTASSSHAMSFSKKIIAQACDQASMETVFDYQQGFSATHFKEGHAVHEHFGFENQIINWKFQN